MPTYKTIQGHPSTTLYKDLGKTEQITVCGECQSVKSVLFLDKDRWFCTKCRNEGAKAPTQVAISNPSRKRAR